MNLLLTVNLHYAGKKSVSVPHLICDAPLSLAHCLKILCLKKTKFDMICADLPCYSHIRCAVPLKIFPKISSGEMIPDPHDVLQPKNKQTDIMVNLIIK